MIKLFLITILFSSVSLSQYPHFETTFNFIDEINNAQELIFGYDAFGTDSLDPQLGEIVVPQVPPGQFGVRFQLPSDTSIYTVKDIHFGCGQIFSYEHLIDLSYDTNANKINVYWNWEWPFVIIFFIDPFRNDTLARFYSPDDSTHFIIPSALGKIAMTVCYDIPTTFFPYYEIISPNGGDTLNGGENYLINWVVDYPFPVPSGKLEFSTDAGLNWNTIIDSVPPLITSYSWLVPILNSNICYVRVGYYPCYCDKSDSFFTITYPVQVENEEALPIELSLSQNYPNPFNPSTKIKYEVPNQARNNNELVVLKVYDVLGNEIAALINEEKPAGEYEVEFDASELPSGIYFYQLKAGSSVQTRKMVLLK